MDDKITSIYEDEQKTASLVKAAMTLAIVISCMGLFGLSLFTIRRRSKEISIRKVLGATAADITVLINRGFITLVALALVIAAPIAWWLTDRWLQEYAYRAPFAWWVFPVTGICAIGIALATVSFQSLKAALANPIKYLRNE
jgi:ABC-type antimicrobial peptide transport system permease subunit